MCVIPIAEAAKHFGVSVYRIQTAIRNGRIKIIKTDVCGNVVHNYIETDTVLPEIFVKKYKPISYKRKLSKDTQKIPENNKPVSEIVIKENFKESLLNKNFIFSPCTGCPDNECNVEQCNVLTQWLGV